MAIKKRRGSSTGSLHESPIAKYEKPKPTFSISEAELPEIKEWSVGKKYTVTLNVEMVSQSQGDEYSIDGGKSKKQSARFKILGASPAEDKD